TKVEFFNNGLKVGESTNTSYTFTWTNALVGLDRLTARATDNAGKVGTSAPVTVTILPPPSGNGIGLYGEYFDNINFTSLFFTRIDPWVNFDWGTGSPDGSIFPDTFSVRCTGQV